MDKEQDTTNSKPDENSNNDINTAQSHYEEKIIRSSPFGDLSYATESFRPKFPDDIV